jgi:hypothetical protein
MLYDIRTTTGADMLRRDHFAPALALALVSSLLFATAASAAPPTLASLEPSNGPERTLVIVKGTGLESGVVVWDAGLPSEKKFAATAHGATMFSVPPHSKSGTHPVAIESAAGRSAVVNFVVQGSAPRAVPRLDGVTLADTKFDANGQVSVVLYVQGANIDVGAKVQIDGIETASIADKAIYDNLFGMDPKTLGYPIRHYLSRLVTLTPRPLGSSIAVKIVNEGGEPSNIVTYVLPQDPKTFSSAGDGIADYEKINGYDNGKGRIDLKALGADPFRKDIFVQVDIMDTPPPEPRSPVLKGTFEAAKGMFKNAPILNPYGPSGIDLFIDANGKIPGRPFIDFRDDDDETVGGFWKLKALHFKRQRKGLYHYAIWARTLLAHSDATGCSNLDIDGTKVGDSFVITMDGYPQTVQSQAETFVHELGHDLGQRHGGADDVQYKPNYWSDMSYSWQRRSDQANQFRREHPTCTQLYYATPGAMEHNGQLPAHRGIRLDYSEGMGPTIANNLTVLDQGNGVCGQAIDLTSISEGDDLIDDSALPNARVLDLANWPNLKFDGPKLGGMPSPCQ